MLPSPAVSLVVTKHDTRQLELDEPMLLTAAQGWNQVLRHQDDVKRRKGTKRCCRLSPVLSESRLDLDENGGFLEVSDSSSSTDLLKIFTLCFLHFLNSTFGQILSVSVSPDRRLGYALFLGCLNSSFRLIKSPYSRHLLLLIIFFY